MRNIILALMLFALLGCGNDPITNAGYFDDDTDKSVKDNSINGGTQAYNNYGGTMNVYNNNGTTAVELASSNYASDNAQYYTSSNVSDVAKHYFPTDLEYIGIYKHVYGAKLVMKNNTAYNMAVSINYTISCSVNGKAAETSVKTQRLTFKAYEQKESGGIDGYEHYGMETIDCTGTITSIIPDNFDRSNFQAWTGNYTISTK